MKGWLRHWVTWRRAILVVIEPGSEKARVFPISMHCGAFLAIICEWYGWMGGWITTLHTRASHHHHHHRHSIILHPHRHHRDEDIIRPFISSSVLAIIKLCPLWRFPFPAGLFSTWSFFFSLLIIPVGNADVDHPVTSCVLWFFISFLHCVHISRRVKDSDNCPRLSEIPSIAFCHNLIP